MEKINLQKLLKWHIIYKQATYRYQSRIKTKVIQKNTCSNSIFLKVPIFLLIYLSSSKYQDKSLLINKKNTNK